MLGHFQRNSVGLAALHEFSVSHLAALLVCVFAALGCTNAQDIQLRGPNKPVPPEQEVALPTEGPGQVPTPTPTPGASPSVPVAPTYRLFCHERYPSFLTVVSSSASAMGFGSDLDLQVLADSQPLPRTGGFRFEDKNLELHQFPQPIEIRQDPLFGVETRMIYSARPIGSEPAIFTSRNIYVSDVVLADRIGRAKYLAPELNPSSFVQSLFEQEGVAPKTFGVSDKGTYLLVLSAKGLTIFEAKTLKSLGLLKWKLVSGRSYDEYFYPTLRESDLSLMVSHVNANLEVTSEAYSLAFNSPGLAEIKEKTLEVSSLRRPLVSLAATAGSHVSGEALYYGLSGGLKNPSNVRIVLAKPATRTPTGTVLKMEAKEVQVEAMPTAGQVPSAFLVWRNPTGELQALLSVENFERIGSLGFSLRYRIQEAGLRSLVIDETRQLARRVSLAADVSYPAEAIRSIESGRLSGRYFGLHDLKLSDDHRAVFALFPGSLMSNIFGLAATGFERISQEDCLSLAIGAER